MNKNTHFGINQHKGNGIVHPVPVDMFLRYDPKNLPVVVKQ